MKRKIGIIIAGDAHIGSMVARIAELVLESSEIIIIGSGDETMDGSNESMNRLREKPTVFEITNHRLDFDLKYTIDLNEVRNPWPSPKGRRGKKRY